MATAAAGSDLSVPWWREPTKDQWLALVAAWLGWMLDGFDFTIFLLILVPIANEFVVSVTAVATVLTFTLWLRLVGAVGAGWLADRIGRKTPLMISILWFSLCNFIAGFSPSFAWLFVVRAILGIGMGAEWPAGTSLAMESWPARSRGFMGGILQGSWCLGFVLSSIIFWLLFDTIGWRGLLWIGILPAPILCAYIHYFVKEPQVWVENRKQQREQNREVRTPLFTLFKPALLGNTLSACWYMAGAMIVYYSVYGLFATWLQTDMKLGAAAVATPILLANVANYFGFGFIGAIADGIGRRPALIIIAMVTCVVAPAYLLTDDLTWIVVGFVVQGFFGASLTGVAPSYMAERFPTEVRTTAGGFCYHTAVIFAGLVPPLVSYFAVERHMGFAVPMLISTIIGAANVMAAALISPETKGKVFVSELMKHVE